MTLHVATDLSKDKKWDTSLFHSLVEHAMLEDLQFSETVPVEVRSLESLQRQGEIPNGAGVLKIDTEGFDLEVIRGMGDGRFQVVMTEFWDPDHPFGRSGHGRLENLVTAMKGRGYGWHIVIYHLDESSTHFVLLQPPRYRYQIVGKCVLLSGSRHFPQSARVVRASSCTDLVSLGKHHLAERLLIKFARFCLASSLPSLAAFRYHWAASLMFWGTPQPLTYARPMLFAAPASPCLSAA